MINRREIPNTNGPKLNARKRRQKFRLDRRSTVALFMAFPFRCLDQKVLKVCKGVIDHHLRLMTALVPEDESCLPSNVHDVVLVSIVTNALS